MAEERIHRALRPRVAPMHIVLALRRERCASVNARVIPERVGRPSKVDDIPVTTRNDAALLCRGKHQAHGIASHVKFYADGVPVATHSLEFSVRIRPTGGNGDGKIEPHAILGANDIGTANPAGLVEERVRASGVVRCRSQVRIKRRRQRERRVTQDTDAMLERVDDVLAIERHAQRHTHRLVRHGRAGKIEVEMVVGITGLARDAVAGECLDAREIRAAKLVPHIDVMRGKLVQQIVAIGDNFVDDFVEFRTAAPVERIRHEHDLLRAIPAGKCKGPDANG